MSDEPLIAEILDEQPNGTGRPSDYSEAMVDFICDQIAAGGSLRRICKAPGMPHRNTVNAWLSQHESFRAKYARARENQAEHHEDLVEEIEVLTLKGEIDPQAARVVIASKQWRMEKLKPKVYGKKVELEVPGMVALSDAMRAARERASEKR